MDLEFLMWFTESAKVHANCFRRREFEAVGVSPDRKFIETTLDVSLDDDDIFRPIADQEIIHIIIIIIIIHEFRLT